VSEVRYERTCYGDEDKGWQEDADRGGQRPRRALVSRTPFRLAVLYLPYASVSDSMDLTRQLRRETGRLFS
jgi:hypothetical protein